MRVISIHTHYAYLICMGFKDIENRSYTIKPGKLLIHSTKSHKTDCITQYFPEDSKVKKAWDLINKNSFRNDITDKEIEEIKLEYEKEFEIIDKDINTEYHNSAIIGCIDVIDCVLDSKSIWAINGQKHWVLTNPVLFEEPIKNVVGRQGIFNIELPKSYDKYFV